MISTQSLSAGCLAAQAAPCRRIRRTQPPTRRMQPMLASAGHQAGGAGPTEPCRKKVAFQQTGGCTLQVEHVTQAVLDWCLDEQGAVGFATADGFISADLADLPEGGRVRLMYMEDVRNMLNELSAQVRSLQQAADDVALGKVQLLGRIIKSFAQAEHPGAPVKALAQTLFNLPNGQEYLSIGAAFIAGGTLYVGHYRCMLNETAVVDMQRKLWALRHRDASPELAKALQGITGIKLYLGFDAVPAGRETEELVEQAAEQGVCVVCVISSGLGLMGDAPPFLAP